MEKMMVHKFKMRILLLNWKWPPGCHPHFCAHPKFPDSVPRAHLAADKAGSIFFVHVKYFPTEEMESNTCISKGMDSGRVYHDYYPLFPLFYIMYYHTNICSTFSLLEFWKLKFSLGAYVSFMIDNNCSFFVMDSLSPLFFLLSYLHQLKLKLKSNERHINGTR